MKRVILLMLFISVVSFSNSSFEASEEILEILFEMEHNSIGGGNSKIKDIEYDLTISQNRALLELEIESAFGDANWSKLDKQVFNDVILKMVTHIRSEVSNPNIDVTVFVKLDQEFGDDKILFNRTY